MKRLTRVILLLALIIGPTSFAAGWHKAGHQIVAAIAYQQLSQQERAALIAILKHHPRYDEDFDAAMADELDSTRAADVNDWLLQRAAIWPDHVKGLRGEPKTEYNRPNWHYINLPCYMRPEDKDALQQSITVNLSLDPPDSPDKGMNVIQTIRYARRVLLQDDGDKADKALMLAWLIHTVGDIHQPLHSSMLVSPTLYPKGDRGGNAIHTKQKQNLHFLWDDLPGNTLQFNTVRSRAAKILQTNALRSMGEHAAEQLDEEVWMHESHTYAISTAYDEQEVLQPLRDAEDHDETGELEPLDLSEDYLKAAGKLASQRLAEAGFRLGRILKDVAQANQ